MPRISEIAICICSLSDRPELSSKTYPALTAYAQKWGYDLHLASHTLDATRHIAWSKILLLQRLLPLYDICVWFDDDILITNSATPLEGFITENFRHGKTAFMVSADVLPQTPMNTGVVFVRNLEQAHLRLQLIWNMCDTIGKRQEACWEQDAFNALWLYIDNSWVDVLPYRQTQSFVRDRNLSSELLWRPGDFAAHVTGMSHERRLAIIEQLQADPERFDAAAYLQSASV